MPLHLLGKKSWNVYNPASIARVRADEAAEAARLEAEDHLRDEYDAAKRLAILRGVTPPESPLPTEDLDGRAKPRNPQRGREREERHKQKRRRGEDDTDRDLRLAREQFQPLPDANRVVCGNQERKKKAEAVPIIDGSGHIQLFAPPETGSASYGKNADAEAERKRKEQQLEDQHTMRFSNAAGPGREGTQKPWYSALGSLAAGEVEKVGRNAFGRPDEKRKTRDQVRLQSADPMAAMRAGQQKLREVEAQREVWKKERAREMQAMDWEERRRAKRYDEEIEEFSLDAAVATNRQAREPRRHRHRSRSPREKRRDGGRHEDSKTRDHHRESSGGRGTSQDYRRHSRRRSPSPSRHDHDR